MSRYLIGIDVGTTGVKTVVCDVDRSSIVAMATAAHDLHSPAPGWSEENPADWWKNVVATTRECLAKSNLDPHSVQGVGVSGMVPALVLLDRNGQPLRPSIQQSDARTYRELETLASKIADDRFFSIAGCALNQQMIGPKILWLRQHEPEVLSATSLMLGSYDYIVYRMTGKFSLERNWALESGLYDVHRQEWSDELLDLVRVDKKLLPPVHQPADRVGVLHREAAQATGLLEGTPVVAGTADHVSSAFMAGIQADGDLLLKFGGAADILCSTDRLVTDRRLYIDYHIMPGKFLLNGCMASSGSVLKWFVKDVLGETSPNYARLDAEAERIPSGSEGVLVLPYFIGEKTPLFDPVARGVVFGLSLHHTAYHIYRAIMEGVAYGFMHHIETMRESGCEPRRVIATDGGSVSKTWGKIVSSVIGQRIHYLKENPGSCLGAAFVAGMGVGCYNDWQEALKWSEVSDVVDPEASDAARYRELYSLYRTLYAHLKGDFRTLNAIVG